MSSRILLLVAGLLFAAPSFGQDYPVSIQPGLVPNLGPSQIVPPRLPFDAGMGRISATIESIERVALVTGDKIPQLACMGPNLGIELTSAGSCGMIEADVRLTPDHLSQEHSLRFVVDQSYLPGIIHGLRKVLGRYPVRDEPG